MWENAIDDIENGFRAFGNLDFGTDWRYFAVNSYANGQWLLGSLQELNGITEATMDFVFAKFGALVLGATVGAVGTAYAEKSLTAGYVNFTINTNSLIQDFNNELSETYLSARNGLANKIIELSFHNKNSLYMTMGPYRNPNVKPYVDIAKSNKDMYFSLGKLWGPIQKTLKYTQNDMFNTFNKPAIDYAVKQGKILRFTMDVRSLKGTSSYLEWDYLKTAYEYTKLEQMEDGFWYAK